MFQRFLDQMGDSARKRLIRWLRFIAVLFLLICIVIQYRNRHRPRPTLHDSDVTDEEALNEPLPDMEPSSPRLRTKQVKEMSNKNVLVERKDSCRSRLEMIPILPAEEDGFPYYFMRFHVSVLDKMAIQTPRLDETSLFLAGPVEYEKFAEFYVRGNNWESTYIMTDETYCITNLIFDGASHPFQNEVGLQHMREPRWFWYNPMPASPFYRRLAEWMSASAFESRRAHKPFPRKRSQAEAKKSEAVPPVKAIDDSRVKKKDSTLKTRPPIIPRAPEDPF